MADVKVALPVPAPALGAEPPIVTSIAPPSVSKPAADVDALKKKYLEERDKRLNARPEGNEQYKQFKGLFEKYLVDPYMPKVEREPLDIEIDFLVLGAGYGGLCVGAELMKAGVKDIRIIDKAGDVGGTWVYWNRYPGAACDIEAYCYMPLLEETSYIPTEKYAKAPELQEHARRIARHFGLYEKALFHTEAREIKWDDASSRWHIKTDRGDVLRTRFFSSASGPLNMPKLPGVDGIEDYKGHYFHTSRWDYEYTGGSIHGSLDKIHDKKVGIIGTGATAIQAVPHLGAGAGHLYVFQRTPSSVSWRNNKATDAAWAASLQPGWQKHRQENFLRVMAGDAEQDLVDDGWTSITRWMKKQTEAGGLQSKDGSAKSIFELYAQGLEQADYENMELIRKRCSDVVRDAATAESLKPWYRQFCKRPCFHDEYLETFNRENVTLVHTDGKGIDRLTVDGIVANGKEYPLDCIIYSTGFEVGTGYERRSNFTLTGRNGISLTDAWSANGPSTLHGLHIPAFPNMFLISSTQSGFAANFTHITSRQAEWIASIVGTCKKNGIKVVEATPAAAEKWTDIIVGDAWMGAQFARECTPGYYNLEGQLQDNVATKRAGSYAKGPLAFCKVLDDWVANGKLEGLQLTLDNEFLSSRL